ncbi:MAG: 5-methylcytosine restriction system specificity protein McrC [Telluria sp.]
MGCNLHVPLADGTLADNRTYRLKDGQLIGPRPPLAITDGKGKNNLDSVFKFVTSLADRSGRTAQQARIVTMSEDGYEHNTDDDFIRVLGSSSLDFSISTGNLVGRVNGCGRGHRYALRITSRFGDDFLKFIIAEADGFAEMPEGGGHETGNVDWLVVYLFLVKLKKAARLGLPKMYVSRTESTAAVRGRLDPVDYMLNEDRGRYACTFREHSYDNDITRLISHTLRVLSSHALLRDAHSLNQLFQVATHGERDSVRDMLQTSPARNPYYADYNVVVALSKHILRQESADFGDDTDSGALLFDVSMLFEYFIRKVLENAGMLLYPKPAFQLAIPTGLPAGYTRRKLLPDLIFEIEGKTFLFEVKYKSYDFRYGVSREDLFQLHTYASQMSARRPLAGCGLIYPIRESRWAREGLDSHDGIISDVFPLGGDQLPFHVAFLKVPDSGDEFASRFRESTATFALCLARRILAAQNRPCE